MSSPIKLAWIGCAHIHTPGFVNEVVKRGYQNVGDWDHNEERALKNAEKLGTAVHTVEELAASEEVTAYVVCSETNLHLELLQTLVATNKPIFVEKPMGTDGANSQAILELFQSSESLFQTGYFMRGQSTILTLKKKVEEGAFGTVTRVRASNCHSGALGGWFDTDWRWMADRSQSGVGAFGDLGTHVLDILLWIFGDIKSVTGVLDNGTARYEGCDELGEALLKFESGTIGTLTASWDDVANPQTITVSGTKGFAILGNDLQIAGPDGKFEKVEDLEPAQPAGFNAFLDHLEGKSVTLVTPLEAARRDAVMSGIYQGAESNTWVSI